MSFEVLKITKGEQRVHISDIFTVNLCVLSICMEKLVEMETVLSPGIFFMKKGTPSRDIFLFLFLPGLSEYHYHLHHHTSTMAP